MKGIGQKVNRTAPVVEISRVAKPTPVAKNTKAAKSAPVVEIARPTKSAPAAKTRATKSAQPAHVIRTKKSPKIERIIDNSKYQKQQRRNRQAKVSSWQNPIIHFFATKYPNFRFKKQNQSKQARLSRQIMTMLAFFSISIGLWENFRQLWLQGNGFSATDVSNVISFATIVGAFGVVFVGKFVKMSQLKNFMTIALIFRCINFLILALLNDSGLRWLIDLFAFTEVFTSLIFLIAIYPLITTLIKNNNIYSRRRLVEYLFRDVGVLIGGIFIGQQIGGILFDYNACLLLATAFLIIATIIMARLDIKVTERAPEKETKFSAVKYILKSRIQRVYMIFIILADMSAGVATGLKMLMLTDMFGFSAGLATNYLLVAGLIADVFGILALRFFTPKNDYLTITLKFGIRFVIFSLAAISGSNFLCFLALTWMILSNTAYENVTDGYYVNSVDNRYQFKYNTVRHVCQYTGSAIGTFLCGQVFGLGPSAVFGLAAFILIVQLVPAYYLVYLRTGRTAIIPYEPPHHVRSSRPKIP